MKKWKIPIRWELTSTVDVEAETVEEAIEKAVKYEHDEGYPLPDDGEYVDGSFEVETDIEWIDLFNQE